MVDHDAEPVNILCFDGGAIKGMCNIFLSLRLDENRPHFCLCLINSYTIFLFQLEILYYLTFGQGMHYAQYSAPFKRNTVKGMNSGTFSRILI